MTKQGIDKAYGMRKLKEILGVGLEEILFIGDKLDPGGNDYPVKAIGIEATAVANYTKTPSLVRKLLKQNI